MKNDKSSQKSSKSKGDKKSDTRRDQSETSNLCNNRTEGADNAQNRMTNSD